MDLYDLKQSKRNWSAYKGRCSLPCTYPTKEGAAVSPPYLLTPIMTTHP